MEVTGRNKKNAYGKMDTFNIKIDFEGDDDAPTPPLPLAGAGLKK